MNLSLAGWSPIGIGAAILIVIGIVLLVAYALRRGLDRGELEGMDAEPDLVARGDAPPARVARDASRTLGAVGATVLVLGLALGVVAAGGGWGTAEAQGPGTAPQDCAQGWNGCPQATIAP
jgi:hypothetical protein